MAIVSAPSEIWLQDAADSATQGGRFVGSWPGGLLLANRDEMGLPSLIIEVAKSNDDPGEVRFLGTNGFSVDRRQLLVDGRQSNCTVISLRNSSNLEPFHAMADGIALELCNSLASKISGGFDELAQVLAKWSTFWKRHSKRISTEKISGLIAEMLAIRDWGIEYIGDASNWVGPIGAPQDFRFESFGVEVKATQSSNGDRSHKISSAFQLDDESLDRIYLLSYRLKLSTHGASSIFELANEISLIPGFDTLAARKLIDFAMRQLSISESSPRKLTHFDVVDSQLFEVRDDFPRIIRSGIPNAQLVSKVRYQIDLTNLREYLIAEKPVPIASIVGWP